LGPHNHAGQPVLPQDPGSGEEGVNYLRRLKGGVLGGGAADAFATPAPAPAPTQTTGESPANATLRAGRERRQSPRLRCSGSVEFRTGGNDVRMWGTLTDVSLHGCYVEMNTTFPAGTKVDLILKSFGMRIQASGTVRVTYPFLGMGICFAEIKAEQLLQLKQLLGALAGHNDVSNSGSAEENGMNETLRSADPKTLLEEIKVFFQEKQMLSREEFNQIAKRLRHF